MNFANYEAAVRHAIQEIAVGPDRGRDIDSSLSEQVMLAILDEQVSSVQAAVFLIALRMKRESLAEMRGILSALLQHTQTIEVDLPSIACLAEPFDGYVRHATMTPFIAPVLAACGMPTLIHGVHSVGPKHGVTAHKVLTALGVDCRLDGSEAVNNMQKHGWTYLDQSVYAPGVFALQGLRDQMIKRTALTTLERVLMPLRAKQQTHLALAYVHKAYPEIYATAAQQAGYDAMLLFKGVEGGLAPALNKPLRQFNFTGELPENVDAHKAVIDLEAELMADVAAPSLDSDSDPIEYTAELGMRALNGESGVARQSLCLAAGQILAAFDNSLTLSMAVEKVKTCLDNGRALTSLNALRG